MFVQNPFWCLVRMSQFVDIIEVGKEKNVSNEKAAEMLQTFITANSGNENDTFDESKIVEGLKWLLLSSWMMLLWNS